MKFITNFFVRRRLKAKFGAYLSPELLDSMTEANELPNPGATEKDLTALYCSIHNYVSLCEQLPVKHLPGVMTPYFTACSEAIEEEGGTIDKHLGDAVVAMFGVPSRRDAHAYHACRAALQIQTQIAALRSQAPIANELPASILQRLRVHIGLNSGLAIVSQQGPTTRNSYTMMGDTVNLAARMESGAKHYGAWTLCTGATKHVCEQTHPTQLLFRSLGSIIVKGRAHRVDLFEICATRAEATPQLHDCVRAFESGLAHYQAQDWDRAIDQFAISCQLEPNQPNPSTGIERNPSTVFLENARRFKHNPPSGPLWP